MEIEIMYENKLWLVPFYHYPSLLIIVKHRFMKNSIAQVKVKKRK